MYGENDQATNQRLFIENKLPQNVELSKNAEKFPTFFTLYTAPISLTEGIKTNYADAAFFKKVLIPRPLFTDVSMIDQKIIQRVTLNQAKWVPGSFGPILPLPLMNGHNTGSIVICPP